MEQGKASQALAYLDKALEIDPEHGQALLNSAILLQEFGRPELRSIARERLLKLLVMDGKYTTQAIKPFRSLDILNTHICSVMTGGRSYYRYTIHINRTFKIN